MAKGIKKKLARVSDKVNGRINLGIDESNRFSRGLAREGYKGGYVDALQDVLLALNGVVPNRHDWWE